MNLPALSRFRRRLADDQAVYGLWITLESPSITEMAVGLGLDWLVIDAEHGHLDWQEIVAHLRAAVRSQTVALVRLAELNAGAIKRALDLGADGVVVPWMESAEQLRQARDFALYPPEGRRGIGAERATAWGQAFVEHTAEANQQVLVVPIVETIRGIEQAPRLADVAGVETFFFGPADLSASAGYRGQWEGPGVAQMILDTKDLLRKAGKQCGLLARDAAELHQRREQGFRMIGLGTDAGLLIRSLRQSLSAIGRDATLRADLQVPGDIARAGSSPQESVVPSLPELPATGGRPRPQFRVGLTGDFFEADGAPRYQDVGEQLPERYPQLEFARLLPYQPEVAPEQFAGLQAALVLAPRITRRSLSRAEDLLVLARFGVGFDAVDVAACTEHDVAVTITRGAVDRPVAEATVGWLLALTHRMRTKDRLVREARWDDRNQHMGTELRQRTLGLVGYGGIGRAVQQLLGTFGMRPPLVFDPWLTPQAVQAAGAVPVSLETLLREADFVSLHCPLNDTTRGLIGRRELAWMKPTAFLINTARGGIVDEEALQHALETGQIAGAALDCFEGEPLLAPSRFAQFDQVLLAPHAIAWTEEMFRDIAQMALGGIAALQQGRVPQGVLNPEVFERPGFQAKWRRWQQAAGR